MGNPRVWLVFLDFIFEYMGDTIGYWLRLRLGVYMIFAGSYDVDLPLRPLPTSNGRLQVVQVLPSQANTTQKLNTKVQK